LDGPVTKVLLLMAIAWLAHNGNISIALAMALFYVMFFNVMLDEDIKQSMNNVRQFREVEHFTDLLQ
jgi:hypothetical protein